MRRGFQQYLLQIEFRAPLPEAREELLDSVITRRIIRHKKRKCRAFRLFPVIPGCDSKVLKRSAGGIATRRARPIRFVRGLAAGFAALRAAATAGTA